MRISNAVIARSQAMKQSRMLVTLLDCFASLAKKAMLLFPATCHARVLLYRCPSGDEEGAGKTGYPLTPAVRVQQKSTRQNHRISQISGLPCAMVLTFIRALLGDRLDCPRRPHVMREHQREAWCQLRGTRTTRLHSPRSVVRPRKTCAATPHVHRIPASRAVTIAIRPSRRSRMGGYNT
jgi:hypothetical protein